MTVRERYTHQEDSGVSLPTKIAVLRELDVKTDEYLALAADQHRDALAARTKAFKGALKLLPLYPVALIASATLGGIVGGAAGLVKGLAKGLNDTVNATVSDPITAAIIFCTIPLYVPGRMAFDGLKGVAYGAAIGGTLGLKFTDLALARKGEPGIATAFLAERSARHEFDKWAIERTKKKIEMRHEMPGMLATLKQRSVRAQHRTVIYSS